MKRITKKLLTLTLAMICAMSISFTSFAAQAESTQGPIGDCFLTFSLTDNTYGLFLDDITITLLNVDTSLEYNYTMTSAEYLLGLTICGNVKQGNYSIALSYAGKDDFIVQNADGTEISAFAADSTEHTFDWVVAAREKTEEPADEGQFEARNTAIADAYAARTGDPEADRLWNDFIDKISVIETDDTYALVLKPVEDTADFDADYYEKATGRSKEEYLNMTTFDKFLWYSTYILPINAITSSDYDTYCGSVAKWNSNSVSIPYNSLMTHGTEEMAKSYRALMEWDYNYFINHGAVMNFMTGESSLENETLDVLSIEDANGNNGDPTKEEIESLVNEELGKTEETDKGIWGSTADLIKDNAVTIAILLILAGAAIGVVIYRKRKTIEDKSE